MPPKRVRKSPAPAKSVKISAVADDNTTTEGEEKDNKNDAAEKPKPGTKSPMVKGRPVRMKKPPVTPVKEDVEHVEGAGDGDAEVDPEGVIADTEEATQENVASKEEPAEDVNGVIDVDAENGDAEADSQDVSHKETTVKSVEEEVAEVDLDKDGTENADVHGESMENAEDVIEVEDDKEITDEQQPEGEETGFRAGLDDEANDSIETSEKESEQKVAGDSATSKEVGEKGTEGTGQKEDESMEAAGEDGNDDGEDVVEVYISDDDDDVGHSDREEEGMDTTDQQEVNLEAKSEDKEADVKKPQDKDKAGDVNTSKDNTKEGSSNSDTSKEMKDETEKEKTLEQEPYPKSFDKLKQLTVNIGPIRQHDLKTSELHNLLSLNTDFDIKFELKAVEGASTDDKDKPPKKEKLGFVRIPFVMNTPKFLLRVITALTSLSIGGRDMSVKFPKVFTDALEEIKAYVARVDRKAKEKLEETESSIRERWKRQIMLFDAPETITKERIESLFPDVTDVTVYCKQAGIPSCAKMEFSSIEKATDCYMGNKDLTIDNKNIRLVYHYQDNLTMLTKELNSMPATSIAQVSTTLNKPGKGGRKSTTSTGGADYTPGKGKGKKGAGRGGVQKGMGKGGVQPIAGKGRAKNWAGRGGAKFMAGRGRPGDRGAFMMNFMESDAESQMFHIQRLVAQQAEMTMAGMLFGAGAGPQGMQSQPMNRNKRASGAYFQQGGVDRRQRDRSPHRRADSPVRDRNRDRRSWSSDRSDSPVRERSRDGSSGQGGYRKEPRRDQQGAHNRPEQRPGDRNRPYSDGKRKSRFSDRDDIHVDRRSEERDIIENDGKRKSRFSDRDDIRVDRRSEERDIIEKPSDDDPKAMMAYLKSTLAKMEQKINQQDDDGRDGDDRRAGKRKGDYEGHDRGQNYGRDERMDVRGQDSNIRGQGESRRQFDNIDNQGGNYRRQDDNIRGQGVNVRGQSGQARAPVDNYGGQRGNIRGQGGNVRVQAVDVRGQSGQARAPVDNFGGQVDNFGGQSGNFRGQVYNYGGQGGKMGQDVGHIMGQPGNVGGHGGNTGGQSGTIGGQGGGNFGAQGRNFGGHAGKFGGQSGTIGGQGGNIGGQGGGNFGGQTGGTLPVVHDYGHGAPGLNTFGQGVGYRGQGGGNVGGYLR